MFNKFIENKHGSFIFLDLFSTNLVCIFCCIVAFIINLVTLFRFYNLVCRNAFNINGNNQLSSDIFFGKSDITPVFCQKPKRSLTQNWLAGRVILPNENESMGWICVFRHFKELLLLRKRCFQVQYWVVTFFVNLVKPWRSHPGFILGKFTLKVTKWKQFCQILPLLQYREIFE